MADLIALGRRLLADPELPNKVMEGRLDDVTPCMACLECLEHLERGEPVQCRVNAALGREREYELKPAGERKKVMVIGGGPAGMEAARVAAARGHEVTLYDREPKPGGLLPLAALIKGTAVECLTGLVKYLKNQLAKNGASLKLGKEVNPALIEEIKPDVAVVAVGGTPVVPDIQGIYNRRVVSTADLRRQSKFWLRFLGPEVLGWLTKFWLPIGKRVVIIGGQIQGCETAEFLVKRGRKVTIIEPSDQLGGGMPGAGRVRLLVWLAEKNVTMLTGVVVEGITDRGITIVTGDGERRMIEADTILPVLPLKDNKKLYDALQGKVPEVYAIGDCNESQLILEAIADGSRIGHSI
jgi:2,4-dienoyl-CoA reductase (NADPH2)